MGYSIDEFVENVDKELFCIICNQVLKKPLSCQSCESLFCEKCLETAFLDGTKCPSCKDQEAMFNRPHKCIQNMLNKLKIKCANSNIGCEVILALEQKEKHEKQECEFIKEQCSNEGCQQQYIKKEKESHLSNCTFKRESCQECQAMLLQQEREGHKCIQYLCKRLNDTSQKIQDQEQKLENQFKLINHLQQMLVQQHYIFSKTKKAKGIKISRNGRRATWIYQIQSYEEPILKNFELESQSSLQLVHQSSYQQPAAQEQSKPAILNSWFMGNQCTVPVKSINKTIVLDILLEPKKLYSIRFQLVKQRFFDFGVAANLHEFEGPPFQQISEGYCFSNIDCSIFHNKDKIGSYGTQAHEGQFVEMVINTKKQSLGFIIDDKNYGEAFSSIPFKKSKFYPVISRDPSTEDSDGIVDLYWVEVKDLI